MRSCMLDGNAGRTAMPLPTAISNDSMSRRYCATRLGRVKGNFKFHYTVAA
jgi:hypothetical protein